MADTSSGDGAQRVDVEVTELDRKCNRIFANILLNDLIPKLNKAGINIEEFPPDPLFFRMLSIGKLSGLLCHQDVRWLLDVVIDMFKNGEIKAVTPEQRRQSDSNIRQMFGGRKGET